MSIKSNFTEDQWFLISSTPSLIGAAMAGAGNSGIMGTVKEAMASVRAVMDAQNQYPDNPLIGAIVQKPETKEEAKAMMQQYREMAKQKMEANNVKKPEELQTLVLADCQKVIDLLGDKVSEQQLTEYKEWTASIAKKVAEAAKEGGFLGFGGTQVSENEQALLQQIQDKLGVSLA